MGILDFLSFDNISTDCIIVEGEGLDKWNTSPVCNTKSGLMFIILSTNFNAASLKSLLRSILLYCV